MVNNLITYNQFNDILKRINLDIFKNIIDINDNFICNLACFITRSECSKPNYHLDFKNTKLNAFTIMVPLTDFKDIEKGHLL